jgi:uncharacterized membrane protein
MSQWLEWWSGFYSDHAMLRTIIEFLHVGGLLAAGGLAVGADRMVLQRKQSAYLTMFDGIHQLVVGGLVVVIGSGVLLFCADVETFLYSKVFWLKMALLAVLLLNGAFLARQEQRLADGQASAWSRMRVAAATSLTLWFVTALLGAALPNIG